MIKHAYCYCVGGFSDAVWGNLGATIREEKKAHPSRT